MKGERTSLLQQTWPPRAWTSPPSNMSSTMTCPPTLKTMVSCSTNEMLSFACHCNCVTSLIPRSWSGNETSDSLLSEVYSYLQSFRESKSGEKLLKLTLSLHADSLFHPHNHVTSLYEYVMSSTLGELSNTASVDGTVV